MMNNRNLWVGVMVTVAVVLFGAGLFLIGNQHKAFRRHADFYTEFANVDGIGKGAKVRVNGADGGQVQAVIIPSSPAQRFRLKMTVDESLHGLIRNDSVVSIETEGLVGDKFLLIKNGSDRSPQAGAGATLPSKEPFDLSKMLDQANGLLGQANGLVGKVGGTITDVQGRLDGALTAVTTTVNNTNGVVTDIRHGKGAAGVLLEDPKTAADVKQIVTNSRDATANLNTASIRVNGIVGDVQQRKLVAKLDDTINNAKGATQQLDQASQQVNGTLKNAFAEDQYGRSGGANVQQSLANLNQATGNLADDTEALKHEFFFKGFFKKRGYDNLDDLPVESYRSGTLLKNPLQSRQWLAASALFEQNADGTEMLTAAGRSQIDEAVSQIPGLYDSPLIVEGYADSGGAGQMLVLSRQRAKVVRAYLQTRFHLESRNTGVIGLSATPPAAAGRPSWNGVCLAKLERRVK